MGLAELRDLYAVAARPPSEGDDTGDRIDIDGWYGSLDDAIAAAKQCIKDDEDHHDTLILKAVGVVQWPALPEPPYTGLGD